MEELRRLLCNLETVVLERIGVLLAQVHMMVRKDDEENSYSGSLGVTLIQVFFSGNTRKLCNIVR